MNLPEASLLFVAAVAGGLLNSVAGGGGFLCFPALVFTGMPPINANATNTVALWPGTLASAGAYRREFANGNRGLLVPLVATGLLGGLLGAVILLNTPQATFMRMVPYLLGGATLLFAFSGRITAWVRTRSARISRKALFAAGGAVLVQLVIAVYIGFFGAGAGILMLAMFALLGMDSIHTMNAYKTVLASVCNGVALVAFIVAGAVVWPQAILMLVGAAAGGYGGAWYAQKMNPAHVRMIVVATGATMTLYFFSRYGF
jgi:uncharacterized protein